MSQAEYKKYKIIKLAVYRPNNKVWGWLIHREPDRGKVWAYAFWGVVGKTISLNRHHGYHNLLARRLLMKKIKNKYEEIPPAELISMWPDFYEQLEHRFIYYNISNGFE